MSLIEAVAGVVAEAKYRRMSARACMLDGGLRDYAQAKWVLENWLADKTDGIEKAEAQASCLISSKKGWNAVSSIAEVLMEVGSIDGNEIDRLCRIAYEGQEPMFGCWHSIWPPTLNQLQNGFIPF